MGDLNGRWTLSVFIAECSQLDKLIPTAKNHMIIQTVEYTSTSIKNLRKSYMIRKVSAS